MVYLRFVGRKKNAKPQKPKRVDGKTSIFHAKKVVSYVSMEFSP